jgi:hypothetical protein
MAITEIFAGLWTAVKPQPKTEKTKADITISRKDLTDLFERLTGNTKVMLRCSHADGSGAESYSIVDGVRGNYLVLFTKKDSSFRFVELSGIARFDLTHDFEILKSQHYYEVRN